MKSRIIAPGRQHLRLLGLEEPLEGWVPGSLTHGIAEPLDADNRSRGVFSSSIVQRDGRGAVGDKRAEAQLADEVAPLTYSWGHLASAVNFTEGSCSLILGMSVLGTP